LFSKTVIYHKIKVVLLNQVRPVLWTGLRGLCQSACCADCAKLLEL